MNKTIKTNLLMITFGVALFAALMNLSHVLDFLGTVGNIIAPVVLALFIAFIFNVPMTGVSKILRKVMKKKANNHVLINTLSMVITFILLLCIITLVTLIIVPQFVASIAAIAEVAAVKIPEWLAQLESNDALWAAVSEYVNNFNMDKFWQMVSESTKGLSNIAAYTTTIVSAFATFGIAMILCIYVLAGKHILGIQTKHVIEAFLPDKYVAVIMRVAKLTQDTFAKFIRGQLLESCILGMMIFVAFTIARLPYAAVAGVMTALFAFIPYVGAFISLLIMMLLIAMTSPLQALIALVVFQIVQFIENHFIYPNVVGNSVGLPALWTLIAVVVGGKLCGVLGMIFFIPIVSVIYTLVRERVRCNLAKKRDALPDPKAENEEESDIE